ncbi:ketopantoate reductase PanE/ApbA C terminal-domain-containing protein [Gymnopilus junonius]|uniref:2-dehydropantoate 2-reductase n=1 Tax=Gymnopilus junonius TaxID=109634 RepID=A0A9P5P270_GYMJU|nr:ketopantoate reductase PanE/ApbA C terminal-domain-containing protein [Gymnopilus junonius]
MHLHVLGLGPIGCLLAHSLRQVLPASHSLTLIHKSSKERSIFLQRGSITLERAGVSTPSSGGFSHEVFQSHSRDPSSDTAIDSVIVALKAQYTIEAIKHLAPRLSPNSTIVLLQNGMGIYEQLLSRVFRNPTKRPHFVLASNTHGAFAKYPYHVVHAGLGSINFGIAPDPGGKQYEVGLDDPEVEPQDRRLRLSDISLPSDKDFSKYRSLRETTAALLLAKSLNVAWVPFADLQLAMRRKLVVNAIINPLTSVMSCRNGDLFLHRPAVKILTQVCNEASAIYAAQMQSEVDSWLQDLKRQHVDTQNIPIPAFPENLTSKSLEEEVIRVAELTKGNISSMLQDVRRGRPTEVEFINGYLENLGKEYGVETSAISMLRNLVELKYFMPLDLMI